MRSISIFTNGPRQEMLHCVGFIYGRRKKYDKKKIEKNGGCDHMKRSYSRGHRCASKKKGCRNMLQLFFENRPIQHASSIIIRIRKENSHVLLRQKNQCRCLRDDHYKRMVVLQADS